VGREAACLQAHRRGPQGADRVAARAATVTIELRDEVAAAALLRGPPCPARQALGLLEARKARAHEEYLAVLQAIDARAGRRPGLRRPRPALGNRLQRMGSTVVSGAAGALAEREDAGPDRTDRLGRPDDRAPRLPAGRVSCRSARSMPDCGSTGLAAGIVAAALASVLIYVYERRARARWPCWSGSRSASSSCSRSSGLAADSATVYLAPAGAARGGVGGSRSGVSIPLGRAAGRRPSRARGTRSPAGSRESPDFKRVYGRRVGRLGRILPRPQRAVRPAPGGEPRDLTGGRLPHWNAG